MMRLPRSLLILPVALLLAWADAGGQNAPPPSDGSSALAEMKKQFEASFRDLQRQEQVAAQRLQQSYLADLAALDEAFQAAGNNMQAVLTVREEKARFERSGEIPDGALAAGLPALRKLQEAWRAQTAAVPREQAQKIVAVSQRYLQSLANLQKALAARNDAGGVAGVQAEKERLLGNNVVREALAALPPANPVPPPPAPLVPPVRAPPTVEKLGDYTFYPPGREPAAKELRVLRLEFPSADRRAAQFFYELQAAVYSHKRDLYDRDSRTTYSITTTIPRITLSVKNRAVGEGSQLVVEYYSRRVARMNSLRHEKSEVIPLPAMARGWILTVEGEGVRLTNEKLMIAPREFYGLIVSLFDAGGALLFQQCTSTALAPNCRATLPEAAAPAGAADELTPGRKAPP